MLRDGFKCLLGFFLGVATTLCFTAIVVGASTTFGTVSVHHRWGYARVDFTYQGQGSVRNLTAVVTRDSDGVVTLFDPWKIFGGTEAEKRGMNIWEQRFRRLFRELQSAQRALPGKTILVRFFYPAP